MIANRNLSYGILLGILLIGSLVYLYRQNKLLKTQTQNLHLQIARQGGIIDSMGNSSMVHVMSSVLDKIDDELKSNPKRMLSDETIAQVAALSYSFKPYQRMEGDSLSGKKLSPERGHLLLMLSTMNIDSGSLHKIMFQTSFSGAYLREADLRKTDLSGADLKGADLHDANLEGANLSKADLKSADLWGAHCIDANMNGADLKRADMKWAELNGVDLKTANLSGADLTSAQLRKSDLSRAIIQFADLSGAFLNEANLDSTDLAGTNLLRAHLMATNLSKAILISTNLTEANLTGANLSGADLARAVVSEENWLNLLNEWNVTGAEDIQNRYKIVVNEHSKDPPQFHLEKIEAPKTKGKN